LEGVPVCDLLDEDATGFRSREEKAMSSWLLSITAWRICCG